MAQRYKQRLLSAAAFTFWSVMLLGVGISNGDDTGLGIASTRAEDAHHEQDDHDHHDKHDHHDDHDDPRTTVSSAVIAEFNIEMRVAGSGTLRKEQRLAGEIVVNPNLIAHVVPRAHGIVQSVGAQIGDRVVAGDVLAIIDSSELAKAKADYHRLLQELELDRVDLQRAITIARNSREGIAFLHENPALIELVKLEDLDLGGMRRQLIGSYAAMVTAQSVLERQDALHKQQIASSAALFAARGDFERARADFLAARDATSYENQRALVAAQREFKTTQIELRSAERYLHTLGLDEAGVAGIAEQADMALSHLPVVSPIDGVIIERHLVAGEKVDGEEPVFVVIDFKTVWADLTVYQRDLDVVKRGMPVRISMANRPETATEKIDFISPRVDSRTRTATARVVLNNGDGLWRPGTFVRGDVMVDSQAVAIAVPRRAVVSIDGQSSIFVRTETGFVARAVRIGMADDDSVEIVAGLRAGDEYASRNVLPLKAELNRAALEHAGHVH